MAVKRSRLIVVLQGYGVTLNLVGVGGAATGEHRHLH